MGRVAIRGLLSAPGRRPGLACILALAAGCHSAAPGATPAGVPTRGDALAADSLELLHAVALRVAAEHGHAAVAVFPLFSRLTGEAIGGTAPRDSVRQRRISQAFADALGVPIADIAHHPTAKERADDATGRVGGVALLVQPDAAYMDLTFMPSAREMHGEWMFTAYRYRFRRDQGHWSFVRREWLGSA